MTLEEKAEGSREVTDFGGQRKESSGRRSSKSKGPATGARSACSRNSREAGRLGRERREDRRPQGARSRPRRATQAEMGLVFGRGGNG